ncbi:MAG TPA: phosphatase PAP2 family protein [Candidatus Acidoferrales bacterium]|nr:phosphatase PAP2 family protein [Candidatus Acidoferrales bacterium]
MTITHRCLRFLLAVILFNLALYSGGVLRAQEATFPTMSLTSPAAFSVNMPAFARPLPLFPAPAFRVTPLALKSPSPASALPDLNFVSAADDVTPPAGFVIDPASGQRDVSWKLLPSNFLDDQRAMWLFPVQLAHGHHWLPTISIIGFTAGLIVADPHDTPYFRRTTAFSDFNSNFSKIATDAELAAAPAFLYLTGLATKDSYAQKTALFAGEAAADGMVFYGIAQVATHRQRPIEIPPDGNFSDTFWDGHKGIISNSFPSGHAIEAFGIATVIARRYRKHRWVPWVAYGAASVISFSRITIQSHFTSDVFLGAAIGYTVARYDVLRGR